MILAQVTARGADDVAQFLERMIPTHCPQANIKEWEEVRDALYALANDTDAIVTDPADVGEYPFLSHREVLG